MTWMHWTLFTVLAVLALGMALDRKAGTVRGRLAAFSIFVGFIVLLVLGQPK